eukprot:403331151
MMKLNQLEKALLNEQNSLTDINNPQFGRSFNRAASAMYKEEYEIKSGNLLYKQEIIAYSVGGLPIYQITITNRCLQGQIKYKKRKVLYICSRVHAGETSASYIMQNIIYELTNNTSNKYDSLLQNYIVKLVPMINVDGVSIGNGRASLVGLDLNRRWTNPNPIIHPEVYFLKRMLKKFNTQYEKGVQIFCDLHGHNKKLNSFVYGCNKAANSGLLSWTKTRLLPKIFASITPLFNYKDCRFKIDKTKLNTARVVCWNELKITNSFTLEASLFGKQELGKEEEYGQISQMSVKDYHDIGEGLLTAIAQYNNLEPELEQEFQQTNGWLKVTKLNDIAGKAARDKLQEENQFQNINNITNAKKSQRLKRNIQQIQEKQKQNQQKAAVEIRHRKSFIEAAYNTQSGKQPSVVQVVAQNNQQLFKRKQSFAQSTTTASGTNQINNIKNQVINGPKLSMKSAKFRLDKYQKRKNSSNQNMMRSGSSFNDEDSLSNSSKSTLLYQSSIGANWRDFFEQKEIEKAMTMAQQNQILEEENEESESDQEKGGSDSEPSEDNIDPAEFYEMMSTVFEKDQLISFKDLIQNDVQFINLEDQNNQRQFQRQSSQNNLEIVNQNDQGNLVQNVLLQSPPYNFKRRQQDPIRQSKDQYYDLQMMKQNQSNRIRLLQEQLEELERQKKQQLILQQQLNQSQSSEQQLNFQIQQYKNPVTSQASKTAYQGWNITKNKQSSANISSNSTSNFGIENLKNVNQKSPEKQRGTFPYNKQILSTNSRIKSSNLFDPSKQKLIAEQVKANLNQQQLSNDQNQQLKDSQNQSHQLWLRNRQKVDLSNNIFAQQMQKHHGSLSPERDNSQRKYSIKVNMVVNEIERLNKNNFVSENPNDNNDGVSLLRNSVIIPDQDVQNTISQFKTQQQFYNSNNTTSKNISKQMINNQSSKYHSAIKNDGQLNLFDKEIEQVNLKSFDKQLESCSETKTPVQNTISPVMFKRFEMNRFPSTSKREESLNKYERASPLNNFSAQQTVDLYTPNKYTSQSGQSSGSKVLPQISLNRAHTQIQQRKIASEQSQKTKMNLTNQTFQARTEKLARLNCQNPYQQMINPSQVSQQQTTSGTGVIASTYQYQNPLRVDMEALRSTQGYQSNFLGQRSFSKNLNATFHNEKALNQHGSKPNSSHQTSLLLNKSEFQNQNRQQNYEGQQNPAELNMQYFQNYKPNNNLMSKSVNANTLGNSDKTVYGINQEQLQANKIQEFGFQEINREYRLNRVPINKGNQKLNILNNSNCTSYEETIKFSQKLNNNSMLNDNSSVYRQQLEKFKVLEEEMKFINGQIKESKKPKQNQQQNIFLQTLIKSNRKQIPAFNEFKHP